MDDQTPQSAEEGVTPEGHYVVQVWGADMGPGELLAVVSDALTAHGVECRRVRVSFTYQPIPSEKSAE